MVIKNWEHDAGAVEEGQEPPAVIFQEDEKASIRSSMLEAIANGTSDGLKLAVNVGAMLIVFTALIYMVNYCRILLRCREKTPAENVV